MKDQTKPKKSSLLNLKNAFENLTPKTFDPCHRGSLLDIFGARYFDLDYSDCDFTIRIPFSDYGDLVLSSDTFYHLTLVYCNITENFPQFLVGVYDPESLIEDLQYRRFCSLRSLFEFVLAQSVDLDSYIESFKNNFKNKKVEVNT